MLSSGKVRGGKVEEVKVVEIFGKEERKGQCT